MELLGQIKREIPVERSGGRNQRAGVKMVKERTAQRKTFDKICLIFLAISLD